ncbi:hypothetical protein RSAG8_01816, partial [Rhizoctonia solani AG-8 WAC10335]
MSKTFADDRCLWSRRLWRMEASSDADSLYAVQIARLATDLQLMRSVLRYNVSFKCSITSVRSCPVSYSSNPKTTRKWSYLYPEPIEPRAHGHLPPSPRKS